MNSVNIWGMEKCGFYILMIEERTKKKMNTRHNVVWAANVINIYFTFNFFCIS